MVKQLTNLFKLRIGIIMTITAVVALVVTPGQSVPLWQIAVLALTVLMASSSAGAFNQYYERDVDHLMERTKSRPFVTGEFSGENPLWLIGINLLLVVGVALAAYTLNGLAALFIFLGAFFYAIVYTVWLKRRSWLNIVIGGASGSFAVLAGAAVVDPGLGPIPVLLAMVLFLWTPPHFWSLAIAKHADYAAAGVPMLPVVKGDKAAAKAVLWNAILLVSVSVLPFFFGLGWLYLLGAVSGGGYFIYRAAQLAVNPNPKTAITSFLASLVQLIVLLIFAVLDVMVVL
ncbi:MAG: heme o synthase [Gammaproteobacteria bacterium]|nr:heme o synthase [Gammaproteobacteria bacterium]MCW9005602.1 heme o synthase [Gammaproteobacteria bacterium]